jgi:hypothetical protein
MELYILQVENICIQLNKHWCQHAVKIIAQKVLYLSRTTFNQRLNSLIILCSEMRNASYRNPLQLIMALVWAVAVFVK